MGIDIKNSLFDRYKDKLKENGIEDTGDTFDAAFEALCDVIEVEISSAKLDIIKAAKMKPTDLNKVCYDWNNI